jgi:hypothetical protein
MRLVGWEEIGERSAARPGGSGRRGVRSACEEADAMIDSLLAARAVIGLLGCILGVVGLLALRRGVVFIALMLALAAAALPFVAGLDRADPVRGRAGCGRPGGAGRRRSRGANGSRERFRRSASPPVRSIAPSFHSPDRSPLGPQPSSV